MISGHMLTYGQGHRFMKAGMLDNNELQISGGKVTGDESSKKLKARIDKFRLQNRCLRKEVFGTVTAARQDLESII